MMVTLPSYCIVLYNTVLLFLFFSFFLGRLVNCCVALLHGIVREWVIDWSQKEPPGRTFTLKSSIPLFHRGQHHLIRISSGQTGATAAVFSRHPIDIAQAPIITVSTEFCEMTNLL